MTWILNQKFVTQPISQTTIDMNNKPFGLLTILDYSNAELVRYSDPHCVWLFSSTFKSWVPGVQILLLSDFFWVYLLESRIANSSSRKIPWVAFKYSWGSVTKRFDVPILNGPFLNGPNHLETDLNRQQPSILDHSKSKLNIWFLNAICKTEPFTNQTALNHSKPGLVQYLSSHCTSGM